MTLAWTITIVTAANLSVLFGVSDKETDSFLNGFSGYICLEIDVIAVERPLVLQKDSVAATIAQSLIDHDSFIMETVELLDFHKDMTQVEFRVTLEG